jgi:Flp pilus assembly protein TadG
MTVWTAGAWRWGRPSEERGTAALEFALVLPFLLALLLGVTTFGLAYADHVALTNSVREAARLGSALDYTPTTWGSSVQTRVQQTYFNTGSIATSQICVRLVDSSGTVLATPTTQGTSCGTAPTPPAMTAGTCAVLVWATEPENVSLGVFPDLGFSIGAEAVSSYGRTVNACSSS